MSEKKRAPKGLFAVLALMLLLVIAGYNVWSFRCGHCTIASLLSFSPPAVILLLGNLLAVTVLLGLRVHNWRARQGRHCDCGAPLSSVWSFCPGCGREHRGAGSFPTTNP